MEEVLAAPREDLAALQDQQASPQQATQQLPQQLPQQAQQADLPLQHPEQPNLNPLEQHMHLQPDQPGNPFHPDPGAQHGQPGFPLGQAGLQQGLQPGPGGEPSLQSDETLMELPESADTKRCAACRIVKPVSEYYKDRTHSRGIKTRCKQCLRACKEAFKNSQRAKSASEQVSVATKKCSHCGEEKAAADFSRSSYQRTGLRSWCKECSSKSKKEAKAAGRWKSYDGKGRGPRKCRKCEILRQAEEFPLDPRAPNKRSKDCQFCLQAEGGMEGEPQGMPPAQGQDQMGAQMGIAPGNWGAAHHPEFWGLAGAEGGPGRNGQSAGPQGGPTLDANAAAFQGQGPHTNESLLRVLRAAVGSGPDQHQRVTPDLLRSLGVYADPGDPFGELDPETQSQVLQRFLEANSHPSQQLAGLIPPGHPGPVAGMMHEYAGHDPAAAAAAAAAAHSMQAVAQAHFAFPGSQLSFGAPGGQKSAFSPGGRPAGSENAGNAPGQLRHMAPYAQQVDAFQPRPDHGGANLMGARPLDGAFERPDEGWQHPLQQQIAQQQQIPQQAPIPQQQQAQEESPQAQDQGVSVRPGAGLGSLLQGQQVQGAFKPAAASLDGQGDETQGSPKRQRVSPA